MRVKGPLCNFVFAKEVVGQISLGTSVLDVLSVELDRQI